MMSKASALVSFCTDLKSRLSTSRDSAAHNALDADLAIHLRAAEAHPQKALVGAKQRAADLDRAGTELWNLCTRLRRELDGSGDKSGAVAGQRKKLLARCRYFAFLLIDIARRSADEEKGAGGGDVVHVVRLALKAGRGCVECGELGVSLRALQRAAEYIEGIKGVGDEDVDGELVKLEVEYFVLRTVQVWNRVLTLPQEYAYTQNHTCSW